MLVSHACGWPVNFSSSLGKVNKRLKKNVINFKLFVQQYVIEHAILILILLYYQSLLLYVYLCCMVKKIVISKTIKYFLLWFMRGMRVPRVMIFFLSMIATCTFITRMNHQRKHYIDFIYIFLKQIKDLMIKSTLLKIT